MNKFNSIFERYIKEDNNTPVTVNPNSLETTISNLKNQLGSNAKPVAATFDALAKGTDTDPLHKKMTDIINPKTNDHFSSLTGTDEKNALQILHNNGVPIDATVLQKAGIQSDATKDKANQQNQKPNQKPNQNATSTQQQNSQQPKAGESSSSNQGTPNTQQTSVGY